MAVWISPTRQSTPLTPMRSYLPSMPKTFLALAIVAVSVAEAQDQNMPPEAERKLAREIYQEMIAVNSGFTTGTTTPIAENVAKRLRAEGFAEADIFVGGAAPNKANVVVRYRGTGRARPILLLAHTDVVEAKREDWTRTRSSRPWNRMSSRP